PRQFLLRLRQQIHSLIITGNWQSVPQMSFSFESPCVFKVIYFERRCYHHYVEAQVMMRVFLVRCDKASGGLPDDILFLGGDGIKRIFFRLPCFDLNECKCFAPCSDNIDLALKIAVAQGKDGIALEYE